jgi:PASTA domain
VLKLSLALVAATALLAMLPPVAAADLFGLTTTQSPANPAPFGGDVTYTITVTNTSGQAYPPPPGESGITGDPVMLELFLLRYQSDRMAPNTYTSVTGSQGTCTPKATKPPSVDCDLGSLAPGASATFTAVLSAQVSVDNYIALVQCHGSCATLAKADTATIVGCGVPALRGRKAADARRTLAAANCTLGKVTRRHAPASKRGRVIAQSPAPGASLAPGSKVAVVLGGP